MIRWDNILGLVLVLLILITGHVLIETLSEHKHELQGLYERTFSPWQRPILKLELLLLAIILLFRLQRAFRRRNGG